MQPIDSMISRPTSMPGGLLRQLYARAEPEFGVDVGQVRLHGSWGDEQPGGDVLVAQALADEPGHVEFGPGQRRPTDGRAPSFAECRLMPAQATSDIAIIAFVRLGPSSVIIAMITTSAGSESTR